LSPIKKFISRLYRKDAWFTS